MIPPRLPNEAGSVNEREIGRMLRSSAIKTVKAAYTVDPGDGTIRADTSAGSYAVTLPPVATVEERVFTIKKVTSDGNAATITAATGELIDGAASITASTQWRSYAVHSDGAKWSVVWGHDPGPTFTPSPHHTTHEPGGSDAMAVDAIAATGSLRTIGTGAQQACAGNDSRLTNSRTPTAHATSHQPSGSDAMAVDAVAATGSLRTIGTGAQQACAGNDSRLSDSRTPTAHKTTHYPGGSDKLAVAEGSQSLANTGTVDVTVPSKQILEVFISADVDKAAFRMYVAAHNGVSGGNMNSIVDTTGGGFVAAWQAIGTIRITNLTGATSVFYYSIYERGQAIP